MTTVDLGMPGRPGTQIDRNTVDEASRLRLEELLQERFTGDIEFGSGTRAAYASDSSNYRQIPLGVVFPRNEDDVAWALHCAREVDAAVLSRGGGTSLAGQSCNVALIIDFSRHMNRIVELNVEEGWVRVQPGIVLDDLRLVTEKHDLTFAPDPATHAYCTIGGMIGNNSCGTHSVYAGKTVDNIESLRVITYDGHTLDVGKISEDELAKLTRVPGRTGEIYRQIADIRQKYAEAVRAEFPDIPRRVSGYNLDSLSEEGGPHIARALVGSESTLVVVTEAKLKLVPWPTHRRLVVLGYEDIFAAADNAPAFRQMRGIIGCEGVDEQLTIYMRRRNMHLQSLATLPAGKGWVLAEFGSFDEADVEAMVEEAVAAAPGNPSVLICRTAAEQKAMWAVRESGLGATARPPGEEPLVEGWEDAALPPERLGEYLRRMTKLWDEFGYHGCWYGHLGDGCMHTRSNFHTETLEGLKDYRAYLEKAASIVAELGGSISGEHGDGQGRAELWAKMFSPTLMKGFKEFKQAWDPASRMNPGKLIDPFPLDTNLKHGPDRPHNPLSKTTFFFGDEGYSLQDAADRCVGVGRCRRTDTNTMCPSYRATRDEKHSTRGRAKLFQEMFRGEITEATWRNEDVKEALDLCLSCKGCKTDCPTNVDMATFKSEFLSHYYKGKVRPREAYSLGMIRYGSKFASKLPSLANGVLASPVGKVLKSAVGVTNSRPAPHFAEETLRAWLKKNVAQQPGDVVLWVDTFTNYLGPEAGIAAVKVMQAAGGRVVVPQEDLCCGRPLYDYGMLSTAKRNLEKTMRSLHPAIEARTPVVVLEPSCLATFRDELLGLFPDDPRAQVLSEIACSLPEWLIARRAGNGPERSSSERGTGDVETQPEGNVRKRVLLQVHCHQNANGGYQADVEILTALGYDVKVLDSGCCGLAGSFGFNAKHADLSKRIAEDRLLPLLSADPDAIVVADGFSCQTQIRDLAGREVKTIAELAAEAMQ
ncbi:FAD-binding and (Fe-S)-binding domain-containing protein [Blastococcus sp. Marseille-P5729]|uniref:FAD-binding and (Fe-S)-binding domain-containing protein n=1 Tax=Blastococcus sp. Marseille-P5729 TaxID=2086582 RepID=UPI000D0F92B7|nr:FAD-binding and (Fe-S)-binding domain-containing protein [Blastococcus sp. Marseille-P5729]